MLVKRLFFFCIALQSCHANMNCRCITINVFYCNSISDLSVSCDNITPFKLTFFISLSLNSKWGQSQLLASFHRYSRQFYLKDHLLQTQLLRNLYPDCLWCRCWMETATTLMINIIISIIMTMMMVGECQVTGWLGWRAGMHI